VNQKKQVLKIGLNKMEKLNIALLTPGLLPIPPVGWGAIEKYLHNYRIHFEKMGHTVEYCLSNHYSFDHFDIVYLCVHNQGTHLTDRGVPYIFAPDDTTPYLEQGGWLHESNIKTMENALLVIQHSDLMMDFYKDFGHKTFHIPHGVDSEKYRPTHNNVIMEHKLLCSAKNLPVDRKGFRFAMEAAINLDLPITIAGPNNNQWFFEIFPQYREYSKLRILDNLDEDQLIKTLNEHTIFMNVSELEAGLPNLAMIEALSCGVPVVGTYPNKKKIKGVREVELTNESTIEGIKDVINNYEDYRIKARETGIEFDWSNIAFKLNEIFQYILPEFRKLKNK
jgi:glycosyltransferase involved in cell wall biosynthesis